MQPGSGGVPTRQRGFPKCPAVLGWVAAGQNGFLQFAEEPEILESAIDRFESAVEDSDIKEIDRANILVMAAQVITDSEALESMFFELNSMENTIAVEAIKKLWVSANETAKALLPETIESVTGEDDITTPEKLDAWLLENLDDQ